MSHAQLTLLHGFALTVGDEPVRVPGPGRRVLAWLALHRRAVSRSATAAGLWPDLGDRDAAARLRSALWRLPRARTSDALVAVDRGSLAVSPHVEVDVWEAERAAAWSELTAARWGGELLTGWDDPWVEAERERFRQLRLHRLEELSARACDEGRYATALAAALSAVAAEPLRESAHRHVIAAHLAEQNPSEALRQYDVVRAVLRDELGLAPAPATRALVAPWLGRPVESLGR